MTFNHIVLGLNPIEPTNLSATKPKDTKMTKTVELKGRLLETYNLLKTRGTVDSAELTRLGMSRSVTTLQSCGMAKWNYKGTVSRAVSASFVSEGPEG